MKKAHRPDTGKLLLITKLAAIFIFFFPVPGFALNSNIHKWASLDLKSPCFINTFERTDKQITLFPVTGKVMDLNGTPVVGASVIEKGTNNGTTTAEDGTFSLNVNDESAILIISRVGFTSQEIGVTATEMNIVLLSTEMNLDEVVVVGYGTQRRRNVAGSTSFIVYRLALYPFQ